MVINRPDRAKPPVLTGPFLYRGAATRGLCLDIGTLAGQKESLWSRRALISVTDITWDLVDQALVHPGSVLETRIRGCDNKGTPVCATVKPLHPWTCHTPTAR
jgi:hypothetical protein